MRLRIKKLNIKNNELLFFIAYGIYIFTLYFPRTEFYIDRSVVVHLLVYVRYISYLILFFELFNERVNKRKLILFAMFFLMLIYTLRISDRTIIFGLIFSYGARRIKTEKILKFTYIYCTIQYCIVFVSSLFGIIQNKISIMDDGRLRFSLGFRHPNNASLYFFILLLLYFCIKKGNMKIREIFFWGFLSIIIYQFTRSRTGIIMDVFVLLTALFCKSLCYIIEKSNLLKFIISLVAPSFAVLNYIFASIYEKNVFVRQISLLLTGRFNFASKALQIWGITPFGRSIQWNYTLGQNYLVVDSSYMRNLIELGVIAFGLLLIGYFCFCWCCIKNKNTVYALAIVFIAVYANMEIILAVFGLNPLLVLFGPVLFSDISFNANNQKREMVYT